MYIALLFLYFFFSLPSIFPIFSCIFLQGQIFLCIHRGLSLSEFLFFLNSYFGLLGKQTLKQSSSSKLFKEDLWGSILAKERGRKQTWAEAKVDLNKVQAQRPTPVTLQTTLELEWFFRISPDGPICSDIYTLTSIWVIPTKRCEL